MKIIKKVTSITILAIFISLPLSSSISVYADNDNDVDYVKCNLVETQPSLQSQINQDNQIKPSCDLAINKQVSVNGSTPISNTTSTAVQAHVGDNVVWNISVTNNSYPKNYLPTGQATVKDLLPSGVTYVSSSPSAGSYSNLTGIWTFPLNDLPTTLTITTTANTLGIIENTASLSTYCKNGDLDNPDGIDSSVCIYGDSYIDANANNNSSNAFVNVVAVPVVVTPTTLASTTSAPIVSTVSTVKAPNTGYGVYSANISKNVALYSLLAISFFGLAIALRRLAK